MGRKLALANIRTDGGTQTRCELDDENIDRLVEILEGGGKFDEDIVVFEDGADFWLSHGFHRHAAYDRAGRLVVPVDIRKGTLQDAIDFACKPHNAGHGKPETRADRRRRAEMAIAAHPDWAHNRIGKLVGMSGNTIRDYRQGGVSSQTANPPPASVSWPKVSDDTPEPGDDYETCPKCGGQDFFDDGNCAACPLPEIDGEDEPTGRSTSPAKPVSKYPVSDKFINWLTSLSGFHTTLRQDHKTAAAMFSANGWEKKRTKHAARLLDAVTRSLSSLNKEVQKHVNN